MPPLTAGPVENRCHRVEEGDVVVQGTGAPVGLREAPQVLTPFCRV